MKCKLKLLSSLEKVFFDMSPDWEECTSGSMLKNEIYSFQLVGEGYVQKYNQQRLPCKLEVESVLKPYIQVKQIGYVPSILATYREGIDDDYLTKTPGMFPDPLHTIKNGEIELINGMPRAFWVSVEPKGQITGTYPIVLRVLDQKGERLAEKTFTLEILDVNLPEMEMRNTGWMHGDCLAIHHNVEILSDAYFEIVEKYLKVYVKFGHNMILTPVFTPPLDTAIGAERLTNQLVDVTVNDGQYSFGFENLKRWIALCQKCGIKYFEISHMFTQWGAYHAPKIMATVDGEYKKIFGWETDALSAEYKEFLDAFLPNLIAFLEEEGIMENTYFHVSDEPHAPDEQQYRAVKKLMLEHLDDSKLQDALSDYSFYEKGIVSRPIASSNHIHNFIKNGVKNLWTYYCMSQSKDVANRFMAMPSHRNRILGYQLYKNDIEGFLQWGFNFWFSQLSKDVINPYVDTTAKGGFPSGDAFIVYPMDDDGEVVLSLRLYVFNEGLQDMRALKLLEELTDKETVLEMLTDLEGFTVYPRNSRYILELREKINNKIKELTAK